MRPVVRSSLALVAVVAMASTSDAQESKPTPQSFGARSSVVVTLDDFIGVFRETVYSPDATNTSEQGGLFFGTHTGALSFAETARLGVHAFVAPWLSLGTGLHASMHESADTAPLTGNVLGVSPRIGFVAGTSPQSAFWFRVGVQYYHHDYGDKGSAWDFGPGIEVLYVYTPHSHFGVTFGPVMELDLAGNLERKSTGFAFGPAVTTETAFRRRMFGLALGFLFDF
jgi:hypothetical protein